MEQLPGLPEHAFSKADPTPDADFYDFPRFVTHIDDLAHPVFVMKDGTLYRSPNEKP